MSQEEQRPEDILSVPVTKKDSEIERLNSRIQNLEDLRKEERFGWIVAILALINYILLKDVSSLLTPLIVFVLELIALLVLARRSGIEYVEIIISRVIGSVTNRIPK